MGRMTRGVDKHITKKLPENFRDKVIEMSILWEALVIEKVG